MISFFFFVLLFSLNYSQTIKQLNEISINEELPIGSVVTYLTDKIPNLDQSLEYDLVTPLSSDLDLFSIDHTRHSLNIKNRIDFEHLCSKIDCLIPISIAVSNRDKIDVYILPIRIKNIDDNPIKFSVNRTVIEIEENDTNWFNKSYPLPRASDADGDLITYSLYLQNWNKPNGLFELDSTNLLLKPLKQFDREQQNLYLLRLVAHNKYQKDVSIDVIILIKDINDNPPICEYHRTLFSINQIHSISTFSLNVTDADEGDNGKLEYNLINPLPGFNIDRFNGEIQFGYTKWIRRNQSKLFVNITDHGKPSRLSTECIVELKFTFLFDINFKSDYGKINQTELMINIENVNLPIGQFFVFDKQEKTSCSNCLMQLNSSLSEVFILDDRTLDLYLNLNSMILIRILSNYLIKNEYLPIMMDINVSEGDNPLIKSSKNYSIILNFNKENLLINSNMLFLKIDENMLLNEKISIFNHYHYCLNNLSKEFILIDSTNTFEIDDKYNLILTKYLNIKQQDNYLLTLKEIGNNQTNEINQCSIQLRLHVVNPYSISNTSPYFPQSFYILTSNNISQFILPSLPSYVKYISSNPNEISIDEKTGSIKIRSTSLFSSYSYDFEIKAIDSQTSSLTCSIPIRILFGMNQQAPRLVTNLTKQTIEISSSGFIYQIEAYDPDLSLTNQKRILPPSIEYEIDSLANIEIEPYSGRIFLKNPNQTILSSLINFTLIMTDFGQPNRLITQQSLIFDIILNEKIIRQEVPMIISTTLILISACILLILILFIIILLCYCKQSTKQSVSSHQTSWKNISPTTPDTRLIDNEYITTTTSLPRVVNREQRIYPTLSYDNHRKLLSNSSLDKMNLPPPSIYSAEKIYLKQDYQQHLSMNDINKYLERFEKIYNNSSEQNFHEPVGSVV